jgi:signal transduction histidine kinase
MDRRDSQNVWGLLDVAQLAEAGGVEAYLPYLLQRCASWFDATGASIFLHDAEGAYPLAAKTGTDTSVPDDAIVFPGGGIAGVSLLERRPLLVEGPSGKGRRPVGSAMVIPLLSGQGEPIGVLNLSRPPGADAFVEQDLAQAGQVASLIALAVNNARLLEQVEEGARFKRLAEIGQMTAAIAHEIRNPLTGIKSAAQMVKTMPEHAEEFGGIIEGEAIKLERLCQSFLDFAKPLVLHTEECDLAQISRAVAERLQAQFKEAGVHLKLDVESADTPITGDPLRLEQVIRNLLLNALQASQPGGVVDLVCREGMVQVRDNGRGIPQEDMKKLFTPFHTTKASGTGLGLSTVHKIVEAHAGSVTVSSEPGQGATFTVLLNRRRAA